MEGAGIEVTVRTPSRLHFGIVDMRGDLGRIYVSVGVAVQRPSILLKASVASRLKAKGPRADRVMEYAEKIFEHTGVKGDIEFDLVSDIPEHAGFGSGTQLALAVGAAISKLFGLDLSAEEIASTLKRSRVSGVGLHAFKHGGFIVDGGHSTSRLESVPPLIFRSNVPEDWFFVVGLPEISSSMSGEIERDAFRRLEPPPSELVGQVSRIVLVQMMPAILDEDIKAFGDAMTSLDYNFGEYWLKVQGGRYSHPRIEEGVNYLLSAGAYGAGQSSWGPAFYGLVKGEEQAREISAKLCEFLRRGGRKGTAFYTAPDNNGASITVT